MAPTKKSSSAKAPAKKPMERAKPWAPAKKSQYELERDERGRRAPDGRAAAQGTGRRVGGRVFVVR